MPTLQSLQDLSQQNGFLYQETLQQMDQREVADVLMQCIKAHDEDWLKRLFPLLDTPRVHPKILIAAVSSGMLEAVTLMAEFFPKKEPALKEAIIMGHTDMVDYLLPLTLSQDNPSEDIFYLSHALRNHNWDLFDQLLPYCNPTVEYCQIIGSIAALKNGLEGIQKIYAFTPIDRMRNMVSVAVRWGSSDTVEYMLNHTPDSAKLDFGVLLSEASYSQTADFETTLLLLPRVSTMKSIQNALEHCIYSARWNLVEVYLDRFSLEDLNIPKLKTTLMKEDKGALNFSHFKSILDQRELEAKTQMTVRPKQPGRRL